jgi:multisubunit Na+/H+ antiporter MnhG subunit
MEKIWTILSLIGAFWITKDVYNDMQEKKWITVVGLGLLLVATLLHLTK